MKLTVKELPNTDLAASCDKPIPASHPLNAQPAKDTVSNAGCVALIRNVSTR